MKNSSSSIKIKLDPDSLSAVLWRH